MKKQTIFGIVLAVLLLGGGAFKYYQYKNPDKFITTELATTTNPGAPDYRPTTTVNNPKTTASGIHVDVGVPINGTLKGVIEVGASGFNSFVVNMDKEKNWELVSKEFGESLAYEGFASTDDVKLGLKKYLGNIFNKGVSGRNAHFVISSGALKNPKTELIASAIEKMGYVVNRVSAEQEGKYALKALLPPSYRQNSYTVDIGSGNTKISWYEGQALKTIECSGAKYYQDKKTDLQVYEEIKTAVSKVPANQRLNCFIIGGIPYQLAKQSRTGTERYTQLLNPDTYSGGDDVKMKSGINIYRSLTENGGGNFIFDWDANFTIGFLLTLN